MTSPLSAVGVTMVACAGGADVGKGAWGPPTSSADIKIVARVGWQQRSGRGRRPGRHSSGVRTCGMNMAELAAIKTTQWFVTESYLMCGAVTIETSPGFPFIKPVHAHFVMSVHTHRKCSHCFAGGVPFSSFLGYQHYRVLNASGQFLCGRDFLG